MMLEGSWTLITSPSRRPYLIDLIYSGRADAAWSLLNDTTKARVVRPGALIEALYIARFEPYKQHKLLLDVLRTSPLPLRLTLVTNAQGVALGSLLTCALPPRTCYTLRSDYAGRQQPPNFARKIKRQMMARKPNGNHPTSGHHIVPGLFHLGWS